MRGALVAGCVPPGEGLGHPTRNGGAGLGNRAVAAGSRVKQRPKAIAPASFGTSLCGNRSAATDGSDRSSLNVN
jgi:hypothetical protein